MWQGLVRKITRPCQGRMLLHYLAKAIRPQCLWIVLQFRFALLFVIILVNIIFFEIKILFYICSIHLQHTISSHNSVVCTKITLICSLFSPMSMCYDFPIHITEQIFIAPFTFQYKLLNGRMILFWMNKYSVKTCVWVCYLIIESYYKSNVMCFENVMNLIINSCGLLHCFLPF